MRLIKIFDKLLIIAFYFYLTLFVTDYSFLGFSISNIGGPTAGMLFFLFLRYIADKKSFFESELVTKLAKISRIPGIPLVFFSVVILALVLSLLSAVRHLSLNTAGFDLGVFDQAVWNTLNGKMLFSSLRGDMNLLGDHFEPILLVFVPFYKLWPTPLVLVILQAVFLSSGIIPLYLIARQKLKHPALICAFILSYCLSRPLRGVGLSDFHLEGIILVLLFWSYYFLIRKKNIHFLVSIFLLLLCKEDTVFLVAALGIYAFIFERKSALGLFLAAFAVWAWFVETKILIPHFNPYGKYEHLNKLPFGAAYWDNLTVLFTDPLMVIRFFFHPDKLKYCFGLFGPTGFLAFLSPAHYILFGVPLLKNMLATENFSGYYKISSHYTAAIIPFVYIAAISGAAKLISKFKRLQSGVVISGIIVIFSLFFYGKTDANKFSRFLRTMHEDKTLSKISYLNIVPQNASVAANANLIPHLSHREQIYEINLALETSYNCDFIVLDMNVFHEHTKHSGITYTEYLNALYTRGYRRFFESPDKGLFILKKPDSS